MTVDITIERLTSPTDAELRQILSLCLRAYAGNIGLKAMVGNNDSLVEPMFQAMLWAGALEGEYYVARNKEGDITSVALWFRPGVELFGTDAQRSQGFMEFLPKLDDATRNWWMTSYGPELDMFLNNVLSPNKVIDTWYINVVATDPDYQNQGLAKRVVNTMIQSLKSSGEASTIALCTPTAHHAAMYQKFGFVSKGDKIMQSPVGDIPVYCLARDIM